MWTSRYVLENEDGERIDLTAPNPVYMVNVEGLGASTNSKFANLQDGFFQLISEEQPQNGITGDLVYMDGAFRSYQKIVNWIMKSKTLYFCYTPLDTEYRKQVRLNYIQKDRRQRGGWMRSAISFYPLTPWYLEIPAGVNIESENPNIKAYFWDSDDYVYTYTDDLVYGGESAVDMHGIVYASGHDPAGFILRYNGCISNPKIKMVGVETKTVYGICQVIASFGQDDTLELSTVQNDSYCRKITGSGAKIDLVASGAVSLEHEPFFRVPLSEPVVISIESDIDFSGRVEMFVYEYYRSV